MSDRASKALAEASLPGEMWSDDIFSMICLLVEPYEPSENIVPVMSRFR
jgi:hypothetical protein